VGSLQIGAEVGRSIPGADGKPLIRKGQIVDTALKRAIQDAGLSRLYITDVDTHDIEIDSPLSAQTYSHLLRETCVAFTQPLRQSTLRDEAKLLVSEVVHSDVRQLTELDVRPLDAYLIGHSVWGALLAVLVGKGLNYDDHHLGNLAHGMLVRDIGTCVVRDEVLFADRMLSEAEFREAQQHARHGFQLLKDALQGSPLARSIALYHHERLDGSGYPRGAKDEEIPEFGRIGAVVDVYDALTSDRPHRPAMVPDQAMAHILGRPHQFDVNVTRNLARHIALYPPGMTVTLDTGDVGVIVSVPRGTVRPVVRIMGTTRGKRYREFRDIDLSLQTDIRILSSAYDLGI
jgi:HD-GYP domain-containing protein (c-di-GMP phosphodiesterase class II)